MKALILKDIYNIAHHIRAMLMTFVILAVCLLPSTGALGCVFMIVIMCSTTMLTTFAYDEASHWDGYALSMPVTRDQLVLAKFLTMGLFNLAGMLSGAVIGVVGSLILKQPTTAKEMLTVCAAALAMGLTMGGTSMPLVFRFGAEKSRIFAFASALVPAGLVGLVYLVCRVAGIVLTDRMVLTLMALSPLGALAWNAAMYLVSCRIYRKKDVA